MEFHRVINLKTAKQIGLTIPTNASEEQIEVSDDPGI
jgi:hypothetical protein